MILPIHEKWARLLVHYCMQVKPGDNVSLNIETPAEAMARALYREVLRAEGNPILHLRYPEKMLDTLELASDIYLDSEPSLELYEIKQMDAWLNMRAPLHTKLLQTADKSRVARLLKKARAVSDIRINTTRWVTTLYPTHALAQDADMNLDDYEKFVYSAMYLYDDDPVAKWQEIHTFQEKLIERLKEADEIHLKADGTDLTLRTKNRIWKNSAGQRNMPSGEVFTGPLEDSANGIITYAIPSSVNGTEVENIRLVFKDGKVVEASAEKGNDLLQAQLDSDDGARYLGEIGIGTNYNIQQATKQILYDEKIGGTVHLAVGQSYTDTGGQNKSAIHWDMICDLRDGGAIYLDGELFQENGEFKL